MQLVNRIFSAFSISHRDIPGLGLPADFQIRRCQFQLEDRDDDVFRPSLKNKDKDCILKNVEDRRFENS